MGKLYKILFFLLVIGIIGVASSMGIKEKQYHEAEKQYEEINSSITNIQKKKTEKKSDEFTFDYKKLKEANVDGIGYIRLKGTKLSYPVVRGADNSFYLNHDSYKRKSVYGAIFMDTNDTFDSFNCILYGHHMNNGSMFATLKNFTDESFAKKHNEFDIYIEDTHYTYEVISSFICDKRFAQVYTDRYFSDMEEQVYWEQSLISQSQIDYKVKPANEEDKTITLSTCTNRGDTRYIVMLRRKE